MNPGTGRAKGLWIAGAMAITVGVYCVCAYLGTAVCGNDDPIEVVYNRMFEGFAHSQLSLARRVPAEFAKLEDPYDPEQNSPYRGPPYFLYDLSYYRGRLYAYFGPVPAVTLFGPYHFITGRYLSYKAAGVAYCALGLIAASWLILSARRRYAPDVPEWVTALVMLTLGLSTGLPTLLARVDIWEIPIAGTTATILWVLVALWQAWHRPASRAAWLAAASLGVGVAVGTRPTAILISPILAFPLLREWREFRWVRAPRILACAALPLVVCVGALGLYNAARFGNPFEFGQTYQLAAQQYVGKLRQYGLDYIWDNVRVYFLNFTPWTTTFPYIGDTPRLSFLTGHADPELCFGILVNVPIVVMAFAALWVRGRRNGLSYITAVVLWVAAVQIGLLMVFFGGVSRYEVEILTPLVLLAAIGLLATETRPAGRLSFRGLWIALAAVSIAFNLCHAAVHADWARKKASFWLFGHQQVQEALKDYDIMIMLEPPTAELHNARGVTLGMLGRWSEAAGDFETALRLKPAYPDAECNLGTAFLEEGQPAAAIGPLEESLRLRPNDPHARELLAKARSSTTVPNR